MILKIDFCEEEHPICCYFCYEVAELCALYHVFSSSYHKSSNNNILAHDIRPVASHTTLPCNLNNN